MKTKVGNHDLPFATELFEAADRLRGSVESAEYKHLVLGLLFLRYISDSFERRRAWLDAATHDPENRDYHCVEESDRQAILEDRDEYISENVFWVPPEARFDALLKAASLPDIGERIDGALDAIERDNPEQLRGVLPKIHARAPIQPAKLGSLVGTIAKIGFGDDPAQVRDVLGRTYEYFIREFARKEGHRGGESSRRVRRISRPSHRPASKSHSSRGRPRYRHSPWLPSAFTASTQRCAAAAFTSSSGS